LKILIISQYFWPENFRINDIVEHFRNENFEVDVLTGYPNYPDGKLDPNFKENPKKYSDYFGANIIRVPIYFRRSGDKLNLFSIILNSFTISGHKSRTQIKLLHLFILEKKIAGIDEVIGLVANEKTISYFFFLK